MKNGMICILCLFAIIAISSCSSLSIAHMTSSKMDKLELGMSKEQVTKILGNVYTIAEKRIEDGDQIEVLSYRDFYKEDEFYLFQFSNDKLKKWYRELLPQYDTVKKK